MPPAQAPQAPQPNYNPTPIAPQGGQLPLQPNAPYYPPMQSIVPPPAAHKTLRWPWILVIGAIILLVAAPVLFVLVHNRGSNSPQATRQLSALQKSANGITDASLQNMDKTALFYAIFRNAAEQPAITTTTNYYRTTAANAQPPTTVITTYVAGYNYQTKQFSFESSRQYPTTHEMNIARCINGKEYDYDELFADMGWAPSKFQFKTCDVSQSGVWINDGLNTGGLSASQADTFVSTLQSYNFITVHDAKLATVNGKQYIRFDVSVRIIPGGQNLGMGYLESAFKKTGLNPLTWPYNFAGTGASTGYFAYFVDPSTQLPAYSQVATDYKNVWDNRQVVYSFGNLPTFTTNDKTPPIIGWPVQTVDVQ